MAEQVHYFKLAGTLTMDGEPITDAALTERVMEHILHALNVYEARRNSGQPFRFVDVDGGGTLPTGEVHLEWSDYGLAGAMMASEQWYVVLTKQPDGSWRDDWDGEVHTNQMAGDRAYLAALESQGEGYAALARLTIVDGPDDLLKLTGGEADARP